MRNQGIGVLAGRPMPSKCRASDATAPHRGDCPSPSATDYPWEADVLWPDPLPCHADVGLAKVVAFEQECGPVRLGTGIGKAITRIEGSWMPPLAELG